MQPLKLAALVVAGSMSACAQTASDAPSRAVPSQAQAIKEDPANLKGERVSTQAPADTLPVNHGAAALQQLLLKLGTRASLMMIVAHPDDEDGGMLAYESRGAGARVAMLTLNRGEGGQNLMSADFDDALGLIRTQELLAADRYMGVNQMFGTEADFGFSKTKEEAFAKWTHERVLYDAVRAVRLYRPLVLTSVFVGGPTDGHGHHQVAGEISQEVFTAAGDPKVFPEMGLAPWTPLKVYARVPFFRVGPDGMFDYATGRTVPTRFHNYVTGKDIATTPEATVLIHEGDPAVIRFGVHAGAPALGMEGLTYVQFARKGLALQKTQIGPGVRLAPPGKSDTGYTLMGSHVPGQGDSSAPEQTLFDGIDTSLTGMASLAPAMNATGRAALVAGLGTIEGKVDEARKLFDPEKVEVTAAPLRDALRACDELLAKVETAEAWRLDGQERADVLHELRVKRVQLNDALVLAHGFGLTVAPVKGPLLTTLTSFTAVLTVSSASANSVRLVATQLTVNLAGEGIGGGNAGILQPRSSRSVTLRLPYLAGLPATKPYFSRPDAQQPYYDVSDAALRDAAETPAPIVAHATLDDQGVRLELAAVVNEAQGDKANPPQALAVVPPVNLRVMPSAGILTPARKSLALHVRLDLPGATAAACAPAFNVPVNGRAENEVFIEAPEGWSGPTQFTVFDPACAHGYDFDFGLTPPSVIAPGASLHFEAEAREAPHAYKESFQAVGYGGLTTTNYYAAADYRAAEVNVVTAPGLRVAYLPGTGDPLPAFLPDLGVTPVVIGMTDLGAESLARFDVVVLGVRAYSAHPELAGAGSKPLLEFVSGGGVVVAEYNSGGFDAASAPYPFTLPGDSAHNVVEEAQPVTLAEPKAAILNWPNRITAADFDGWTEERGHGFAATWDGHYEAPLETHDEGQDPQRGGLLVGSFGKGAYVYCALALYRQVPEAVPGAYRLLANLLSYAKNPGR